MKLKLKDIRINGGTQLRHCINDDTVQEYKEAYNDGERFPPLTVFFDLKQYWLADGFHRYDMYQQLNVEDVDVEIKEGSLRDAVFYAASANSKHGLRRTNEDKRKAVLTILDDMEWSQFSDHKIGKICGVSHMTVGRIKKSLKLDVIKEKIQNEKPAKAIDMEQVPTLKDVKDDADESLVEELSAELAETLEENARLKDKLLISNMDENQEKVQQTIEELRNIISNKDAEIKALTNSRNKFQAENAELIKQVNYWKKRAEKVS
jgi:hypothetical protein